MSMPISSLPSDIPEVPIFSAFFLLILNLFGIIWSVIIVVQILLWIFKNFIKNPIISRHRARSHCQDFSALNTNKISEEIEKQLSIDNDDLYWCDISIKEEGISTIILAVIFFGFQYILFIISGGFDVQFFKPIAVFCGLTTIPFLASVFSSVMDIVRNQHWQAIYMLTSAGAVIITPGLFGLSNHILTTSYTDMRFCEAKDGNLFYTSRRKVQNSDGGTLLTDDVPPQNNSSKDGFYHIYDVETPADIIRAKRNAEQVPILSISDFVNFNNFSSPPPSHQNAHQLNIISSSSSNPSSIPSIPSVPSIPSSSLHSHNIAVSGIPYFQPVATPAVPVPITVFISYGSQLIGFVKILPTAIIADLRLEIESDEISVPPNYTFVFLSAPVTSKQETKLTVGECVSIVDSKNVIYIVSHD